VNRREFIKLSAGAGAACVLISAFRPLFGGSGEKQEAETETADSLSGFTWVSPRGSLAAVDDFCLWVALDRGYFRQLGLDVTLEPGPREALAVTRYVDQGRADAGYPSPPVLTQSVEQGLDSVLVYQTAGGQLFDFAAGSGSGITSVNQLEGRTIAVGYAGWELIVHPLLAEHGIDPDSVRLVAAGMQGDQAVVLGRADAALCWEGLRAQWQARSPELRFLIGQQFSSLPSGGYVVRGSDLKDAARRELIARFLRAVSMGMHFYTSASLAAAQILAENLPVLLQQATPDLVYRSLRQVGWACTASGRAGRGYGWIDRQSWASYLDLVYQLGHTKERLSTGRLLNDELPEEANRFDTAAVEEDAASFKLREPWKNMQEEQGAPF
jgi:NitT/TauT family transport system substrate-binding protein